jgi:serine/threonine protein kinase
MDNSSEFFDLPSAPSPESASARELIGSSESGYSEIWRRDRGGRFRVLKCLKEGFRGNPLYERLLKKEFEIGYSLSHENICEYYSFEKDPELGNCIEMEWVDGRTLDSFLSEGKHERGVYDKVVGEICSALSYMHAKQVLHRDLKPSNILITYNGNNVKLIDFGLSDTDSSSVLKNAAGTVVYSAPEVRSGGKASVRSDLYSLGMVISILPVRKYTRVVRRLCSVRPEARFSSVSEVQKALNSKAPVVMGILLVLVVALLAMAPALNKLSQSALEPATQAIEPTTPTPESVDGPVAEPTTPAPEPAEGPTKHIPGQTSTKPTEIPAKKSPSTKSTDVSLIDELFRQATDLFE